MNYVIFHKSNVVHDRFIKGQTIIYMLNSIKNVFSKWRNYEKIGSSLRKTNC